MSTTVKRTRAFCASLAAAILLAASLPDYSAAQIRIRGWGRRGGDKEKSEQKSDKKSDKKKSSEKAQEVIIPSLGVKVIDVDFLYDAHMPGAPRSGPIIPCRPDEHCQPKSRSAPRVTAVQEGGPAFLAGITPGDIIIEAVTLSGLGAADMAAAVENHRQSKKEIGLGVYYRVADSQYGMVHRLWFPFGDAKQGRWITETPTHTASARTPLSGFADAKAATKGRYEELLKQTKASIVARACNVSWPEIKEMAQRLYLLAESADIGTGGTAAVEYSLDAVSKAACDVKTNGALPGFEATLWAIADGQKFSSCSYSPSKDYSAILNDPEFILSSNREKYNTASMWRFQNLMKNAAPAEKECFLNLIKSRLTGDSLRLRQ